MSKIITKSKKADILHVSVPNDAFDEIKNDIGGWAESSNYFNTTVDNLYDHSEEEHEFALEVMEILEAPEYEDIDEVVVGRENPK